MRIILIENLNLPGVERSQVNEISAEFDLEIEYHASSGAMDLNLVEIFLSEQSRLRRIAAGMGFDAADAEDVLQDVSIKAMRQKIKFETKQPSLSDLRCEPAD